MNAILTGAMLIQAGVVIGYFVGAFCRRTANQDAEADAFRRGHAVGRERGLNEASAPARWRASPAERAREAGLHAVEEALS